ncbi:hypothetical protein B5S29_g3709 [[Candida] boidinii]|nr:hypothetical protein B5S29_g3709 [[Candida] boidinii]
MMLQVLTKASFRRQVLCLKRLQSTVGEASTAQLRTSNSLKKPQFDFKYYNENIDLFNDICEKRNTKNTLGDDFSELFSNYSNLKKELLDIKQDQKKLQKELKDIKILQKKDPSNSAVHKDKEAKLFEDLSKFKPLIKKNEDKLIELEDELTIRADGLPNLIDPSVKSKQTLLGYINPTEELTNSKEEDFPLIPIETLDHKDIMERLGLVDFQLATKISGRGWYYLIGDGALLEQALVQYALSKARQNGFKMVIPPSIVKTEITNACGFKPRDTNNERQVYELKHDNLCLTGTAEISLAALHSNDEIKIKDLPMNYVGVSRSYRAEAGAAGRDTRGLYRVHEFTKVELFSWTENNVEVSNKHFKKIVDFQIDFIKSLGLTARILKMPYDDLGAPAYQKIDIEALMPGKGSWGEVSSTSNCLDYQSRRLTTKYRDSQDSKLKYVHTLNGTACAVPRIIVAIIENNYDPKSDSIKIPDVLVPYMDGKTVISKE